MREEEKNVFERHVTAQQSVQEDRKNRFERHEDSINQQRRDTSQHDARVKHLEQDNARWLKKTFQPTAAGGTPLPSDLAALKAASDADREGRRNSTPPVIPAISTIIAVIEKWQREQSHYFESAFNYSSLVNYLVTGIANGSLTLSVEAVADGYVRLLQNNMIETAPDEYFDPALNAIVRKRGTVQRPAPVLFPKYVWPTEEAAAREADLAQALAEHEAGRKAAESRPFADLQKDVRKDFKSAAAGITNVGERVR